MKIPTDAPAPEAAEVPSATDFLISNGFQTSEARVDDTIHRYAHNCGAGEAAWAVFHTHPVPRGSAGCHRCGLEVKWSGLNRPLTDAERAEIAKIESAQGQAKKDKQDTVSKCLEVVLREMDLAPDDHPYLVKKGIHGNGAKLHKGALILPLADEDGKVWSAQGISDAPVPEWGDKSKSFINGGRVTGCFFTIGELKGAERILVCEGFATGATLYEVTGIATVCAMSASNMKAVAKAMRSTYPKAAITICADSDRHTAGNPGEDAAEIASLTIQGGLAIPEFEGFPADRDHTDFNDMARVSGREAVKKLVMGVVPPIASVIVYDASTGWWSRTHNGAEYIAVTESSAKRHIHIAGVSRAAKGDDPSPLDRMMDRMIHEEAVDYAGAVAGWRVGLSTQGGRRVLVTSSCPIPRVGGGGSHQTILNILTASLGNEQTLRLLIWLHVARRRILSGVWHPLPALVLVGPRNSCKSLIQGIITWALGGRSAKPAQYMQGVTPFNGDLFGAEHLMFEDETALTDRVSRRHLGETIKSMLFCRTVQCHPKHKKGIPLEPFWALSMSLNNEHENVMVLPPMGDSLGDKLLVLMAQKHERPVPAGMDETEWLGDVLRREMPSFIALVDDVDMAEIEPSWKDSRTIVAGWQNPLVMTILNDLSQESQLASLIDDVLFSGPGVPVAWIGTAEQLARKLKEGPYLREAERLLSWATACGVFLARLSAQMPERFKRTPRSTGSIREWRIEPPISDTY